MAVSREKVLGTRLREARKNRGLTQERLAVAAGVSRETVRRVEAGDQSPRTSVLVQLARALEVDPGDLLREGAA